MIGNGSGMGWMWVFGLLLLVGLVLLVVVAVRAVGGGVTRNAGAGAPTGDRPPGRSRDREVLDERYARGELNTEEYHERRQAIGEDA